MHQYMSRPVCYKWTANLKPNASGRVIKRLADHLHVRSKFKINDQPTEKLDEVPVGCGLIEACASDGKDAPNGSTIRVIFCNIINEIFVIYAS